MLSNLKLLSTFETPLLSLFKALLLSTLQALLLLTFKALLLSILKALVLSILKALLLLKPQSRYLIVVAIKSRSLVSQLMVTLHNRNTGLQFCLVFAVLLSFLAKFPPILASGFLFGQEQDHSQLRSECTLIWLRHRPEPFTPILHTPSTNIGTWWKDSQIHPPATLLTLRRHCPDTCLTLPELRLYSSLTKDMETDSY